MTGLRERHKREREHTILSAAEALFRQNGYEATTIAQIGKMANVSTVTVFNYYKTKGELLLALIADENETLLKKIEKIKIDPGSEPKDVAFKFFSTVAKESLKKIDKEAWRQVIATSVTNSESEFNKAFDQLRQQIRCRFVEILKLMMSKELIRAETDVIGVSEVLYAYHYKLFTDTVTRHDFGFDAYSGNLKRCIDIIFR